MHTWCDVRRCWPSRCAGPCSPRRRCTGLRARAQALQLSLLCLRGPPCRARTNPCGCVCPAEARLGARLGTAGTVCVTLPEAAGLSAHQPRGSCLLPPQPHEHLCWVWGCLWIFRGNLGVFGAPAWCLQATFVVRRPAGARTWSDCPASPQRLPAPSLCVLVLLVMPFPVVQPRTPTAVFAPQLRCPGVGSQSGFLPPRLIPPPLAVVGGESFCLSRQTRRPALCLYQPPRTHTSSALKLNHNFF